MTFNELVDVWYEEADQLRKLSVLENRASQAELLGKVFGSK
jgi:hypothetical protein